MTFFNKKEDIMEFKMTQYGKFMLSQGKFKPHFYSFFDDDVVYDSSYGGVIEEQGQIADRIKEDIQLRVQHLFGDLEERSNREREQINQAYEFQNSRITKTGIQDEPDRIYYYKSSIGNSSLAEKESPYFSADFITTDIDSISYVYKPTEIPVIETTVEYTPKFLVVDTTENMVGINGERPLEGTYTVVNNKQIGIIVESDDFLMSVIEENIDKTFQGDIEVEFFIEDPEGREDGFRRLAFPIRHNQSFVRDGILLDEQEIDNYGELETNYNYFYEELENVFSNKFYLYYLDVETDLDIDDSYFCKRIDNNIVDNIFIDDLYDCSNITRSSPNPGDIYSQDDYRDPCDD